MHFPVKFRIRTIQIKLKKSKLRYQSSVEIAHVERFNVEFNQLMFRAVTKRIVLKVIAFRMTFFD